MRVDEVKTIKTAVMYLMHIDNNKNKFIYAYLYSIVFYMKDAFEVLIPVVAIKSNRQECFHKMERILRYSNRIKDYLEKRNMTYRKVDNSSQIAVVLMLSIARIEEEQLYIK